MDMNPLAVYKSDHKLLWRDLSEQTGLSKNALILLARLTPDTMGHVRLGTVVKLQQTIGVNLFEYLLATKA